MFGDVSTCSIELYFIFGYDLSKRRHFKLVQCSLKLSKSSVPTNLLFEMSSSSSLRHSDLKKKNYNKNKNENKIKNEKKFTVIDFNKLVEITFCDKFNLIKV